MHLKCSDIKNKTPAYIFPGASIHVFMMLWIIRAFRCVKSENVYQEENVKANMHMIIMFFVSFFCGTAVILE